MTTQALTAALLLTAVAVPVEAGQSEPPPNFVVIFTDDQGYADVGCYGAVGFETPNLDRMAEEGTRFTSFYVSQAVCSASRASLMTGCYSNRVSIYGALNPTATHGLHPDEMTIAEVLKQSGYAAGAFGKWHLGHLPEFLPLQHGFDEYLGVPYSNDMWPFTYQGVPEDPVKRKWKASYPNPPVIDGEQKVDDLASLEDQSTLTRRYTERAVAFIEKHADEPFFLYVPHSMPHTPIACAPEFRGTSTTPYGDVIREIDWSVGQILATLERLGLDERTLVMFTSDNGPWLNFGPYAGSALPLREGKGTMFEGGCRVPCIVRWPGVVPAGRVVDDMAATVDVLPTLAELAGAPLPEREIDGLSLAGLLRGESDAPVRDAYYFYYGRQLQAVREGPWKLHLPHGYRSYERVAPATNGGGGPYAWGRTSYELYNLVEDIGERRNVIDKHPDVVERLKRLAEAMRNELGDDDRSGAGQRPCGQSAD
jgi:arylsulfatase A-like enzyme